MSPEERSLAISILKEYGFEGKSETFEDLIYEDYKEIPVDILTFVDDDRYLGSAWHDAQGNSKLYPYWRKELLKIFPDNITTNVNNAIFSGSRGRGKSEICVLIACYLLHRILCLKNPIEYYHLKSTEKIVFAFMNIKLALAEEIATTKFQNTIKSSPWFLAHGTLEGRTKKVWVPNKYLNANGEEQEAVDIKIGSQADDLIGLPIYFCFCLDGDTIINTTKGDFKIKELENKEIQVYNVDENHNLIVSNPCTVKCTGESSVEYQLTLEDGTVIKCTPNHQFLLTDGTYKQAKDLTEDDDIVDFQMYGYIYKTTNILNGKSYIGKHKCDHFDFDSYKGSGTILADAFKKYGKENFKTELLNSVNGIPVICKSEEELNRSERYYIEYFNCTSDPNYYNYIGGGTGGDIYHQLSSEDKLKRNKKISDSLKVSFSKKSPEFYESRAEKKRETLSKLSEEEKNKRKQINSEAQKRVHLNRTEEEKSQISESHKTSIKNRSVEKELLRKQKEKETKNSWTEEQKLCYTKKLSESIKGRVKFTNGIKTIYVIPGQEPEGFYRGGGNKNKFKYIYTFNGIDFKGISELESFLKLEFPYISCSNIESIIRETKQASNKYPQLIGKISKRSRYENNEN